MGTIFYNNIPLSTINPYTLLFKEHSLNCKFNNTLHHIKALPLIIFTFISVYSLSTFIFIIITTPNYIESILSTTALIISMLCLIISLFIKIKKNCISIKNERHIEITLLTLVFILFTLINQILCSHIQQVHNINCSVIEIVFINIEMIAKCIWIITSVNEFAFFLCGTIVNCVIVIPYNYAKLLNLFSLVILFGVQCLYSYFFTKVRKELFIKDIMNIDINTNEIIGLGYANMYLKVDNNKGKVFNERDIMNNSVVNENSYLKNIFCNAYEDKENLFSLLNDLEDINEDIKKGLLYCMNYQSLQIQQINNEKMNRYRKKGMKMNMIYPVNSLIPTTEHNAKPFHKIENSLTNLVSKVSNNFQLISNTKYDNDKTEKSRTFEDTQISKFGYDKKQNTTIEFHPNFTLQLSKNQFPHYKHTTSLSKNDTSLQIEFHDTKECQFTESNTQKLNSSINNSSFLLPLLYSSSLHHFIQIDEFIYLGRKRINIKVLKSSLADNVVSTITNSSKHLPIIKNSFDLSLSSPTDFSFYKIFFRFNTILHGLEFIFIDESKDQFETLFKAYSRQVSMYLHDFKNPLTAINEKILDYKDVFQSILIESEDEEMGVFKFGKNELDDMVFLSITSEDCLGMIKSYEDYSKGFAKNDNSNDESMNLNLSLFHLSEITNYLEEWIHIKNIRTHQNIEFIINDMAISKQFTLYTDKLKLKQILINIISNSYKFTKQGSITLTITREKVNNKQYTKFHIRDSGDGMDENTMKNLFNPYFSKIGDNRNKEGCGLGLVLSMRMSKNLGLPIQVDSKEHKGTSMWFYIEERKHLEGNQKYNKNEEIDMTEHIHNNSTSLINCVGKEDDDNICLNDKTQGYSHKNVNKSESNIDFLPLNLNESKIETTALVDDSSFLKSKKNLNENPKIINKPNKLQKLNSFQSTETIICDNIMSIDPKEKVLSNSTNNLFTTMSPQRPLKMDLNLRVSHRFQTSKHNYLTNSVWKKKLIKNKFPSSIIEPSSMGLTIINQEITMSIPGKPTSNYIVPNNNYMNYQFNNSNHSQLYRNNFTLNTSNNNINLGFSKKATGSSFWTKHLSKTKGSTFFNVKSLLSKKDTKTTNAFSENIGLKNEQIFKRDKTISVLLVDDDENFQRAHKRLLENLGVDDVVSIYDGVDLMMMFLRNELTSFDLIILDNFMTCLNGTEVAKIIKFMKDSEMGGRGGFDFTVLNKIFISTGAQDIAMSSLEQFDTVDFVAKPICRSDMENILKKVLSGEK